MLSNRYKISRNDYEDVLPEETFIDSLSNHSSIEIPVSRAVFGFIYAAIGLCCVLLIGQAVNLQIVQGEQYALHADFMRSHRYPVVGLRGNIFDSHGVPLVENVAVFDLVVVRSEFMSGDVQAKLATLGLILKEDFNTLENDISKKKNDGVFALRKDISQSSAVSAQAARLPGVYVIPVPRRHYIGGAAVAHVLGYTTEVSKDEVDNKEYFAGDRKGRSGIEAFYERYLRGKLKNIELGSEVVSLGEADMEVSSVNLTIDSEIQKALYNSTKSVFDENGIFRGAAIVQNVKTGAILGLVSIPSYDPNVFEGGGSKSSEISKIFNNKNRPLFNRAISGLYAPGSTIKPLYALAGLKEHIVTPSTLVFANGSIEVQSEVDPAKTYIYRDWKTHGWTDIRKSIAWSVDVYYYALGGGYGDVNGLGIDRIGKYLKMFGADEKTGVDLPAEVAGFVPSKQWKKSVREEAWYLGDTYNISIGQGDLQVSPIWLSSYVSSIANGGRLMQPYLVSSITRGGVEEYRHEPVLVRELPFDSSTMKVVQEGMRQTITDGTAQSLKTLSKPVAAKTGTAQVFGNNLNSLFIVYGPTDDPEVSLVVLVEQISDTQSLGVQVAKRFYEWYFNMRK